MDTKMTQKTAQKIFFFGFLFGGILLCLRVLQNSPQFVFEENKAVVDGIWLMWHYLTLPDRVIFLATYTLLSMSCIPTDNQKENK
jgi:hypothetical protein